LGPITHAPSLLDGDGGFPRTAADLWDHADLDEVRRECRAQLERAIYWGFDVSHLDAHLDAVQLKPEFFDVFLDLAEEFGLPLRLPDASAQRLAGFPFRALAAERGVVSPDRVILTGALGGNASERLGGTVAGRPAAGSASDGPEADDSKVEAQLAELLARVEPGSLRSAYGRHLTRPSSVRRRLTGRNAQPTAGCSWGRRPWPKRRMQSK